jgi:hypothetical protein
MSESELQYLELLGRELGLGEPMREYRFTSDRQFRADLAWPEHWLLLEIEGGTFSGGRHTRPLGYERDCEKYSIASILGYTLIRVTYGMIESGQAAKLLEMAANKKNHPTLIVKRKS